VSNYERAAERRPRRGARILPAFFTLLLIAVFCVVGVNALFSRPNTAVAASREDVSPSDRQSESAASSGRQTDRTRLSSARSESEDWMLTLVNAENQLSENDLPQLKSLVNGLQFDERAIDQLNAMLSAASAEGLSPVVCSAYRSAAKQRTLYNNKVASLAAAGLSREQAEKEARRYVAYPGTSEHNLGLAADIVSMDYQLLDEKQADTPEVKWLMEHCAEYGFILRYPKDKTDITGVTYEPWHFRYVGAAAAEIMESGLCLEEYLTD
jgi:D-alanyl-D-alanine carboxypeptidase